MSSAKDQGNEEFKKENYLKAAALYTQAIKEDPNNAVLYSNRSAALLKLNKVTKALEDAEKCVALSPQWEKAYFRKASVLEALDKLPEALEVYQQAAKLSGDNKELSSKIRTLSKVLKVKTSHREETLEAFLLAAAAAAGGEAASSGRLQELVREVAAATLDSVAESGSLAPSVHFLPGPCAEAHEERETHVQAAHAFASPEMYSEFVGSMAAAGQRLDARAVLAVVPKTAVAYPQVWQRKGWPAAAGKQAGFFVTLEAAASASHPVRQACFMPVGADKSVGKPIPLAFEDFAPLPPLLK